MNIFDLNTKEKLDAYGDNFLVIRGESISPAQVTGFDRAVVLLDFNANFRQKTITLVVGIYELDENGDPIISKSLKPYEDTIIATNGTEVDAETMEIVRNEEDKVEGRTYIGEFDAYIYLTKSGAVPLWNLFSSAIITSSLINPK
jgi:hypothetical protein